MQASPLAAGNVGVTTGPARASLPVKPSAKAFYRVLSQVPDLVNGKREEFKYIFVSEGLPSEYFWIPEGWMSDLPELANEETLKLRTVVMATYMFTSLMKKGMSADKAKLVALIIASGRLAIMHGWKIVDADIIGVQTASVDASEEANVKVNDTGGISGATTAYGDDAEWDANFKIVEAAYGDTCDGLLAQTAQASIGMPACNGCVIVTTTTHHYVDPHKGICDAVIMQVFGSNYAPPSGITMDDLKDAICHKVSHPIDSAKLVYLARSTEVRDHLKAIGLGSAAVRLPAQFTAERAISALATVVRKGAATARNANVAVDVSKAESAIAEVTAIIANDPSQKGLSKADDYVETFKQVHGTPIAWLAGFLKASFQATDANVRSRSCLEAWSVKGLLEEYGGAFAEGSDHHANHAKWSRQRAKEGILAGIGLMGADSPEPLAPPDADKMDEKASK